MDTAQRTRADPLPLPSARPRPRWGGRPSLRDTAIAAALTVIAVLAAYGEAHPTQPGVVVPGSAASLA